MNSKITLPRLAALLAERADISKRASEEFIKSFFGSIASALDDGDSVKVKGLGVFKSVKVEERKSVNVSTGEEYIIPAHNKVTFTPAKELAAAVNAPFDMFEPVELSDLVSEEDLAKADSGETIDYQASEESVGVELPVDEEEAEETEVYANTEAECMVLPDSGNDKLESDAGSDIETDAVSDIDDAPRYYEISDAEEMSLMEDGKTVSESESESVVEQVSETTPLSEKVQEQETNQSPANEQARKYRSKHRRKYSFGRGFFIGFASCLLITLVFAATAYYYINRSLSEIRDKVVVAASADSIMTVPQDTLPVPVATEDASDLVPTRPSDLVEDNEMDEHESKQDPVYDTVTTTRYLTIIAKEHYGDYKFWPYIYEANKSKLGHPNKIRPGTRVVVPPLSDYGVDPNSAADKKKAVAKGAEIYARFE